MKPGNPLVRVAAVGAATAAVGIAGAVLPLAMRTASTAGGGALAIPGGLLAGAGLVVAVVYGLRGRVLGRMLRGEGVLARWSYAPEATADLLSRTLAEERKRGRRLFLVCSAVCIAAATIVGLARPGAGRYVVPAALSSVFLSAAAADVVPRLRHSRRCRGLQEAIISRDGAYVCGRLYAWSLLGAYLVEVRLAPGDVPALEVKYRTPIGGEELATACIPVPSGREGWAADVARALRVPAHGSAE